MLTWVKQGFKYVAECEFGVLCIEPVTGTGAYKSTLTISNGLTMDIGYYLTFAEAQAKTEKYIKFKREIR